MDRVVFFCGGGRWQWRKEKQSSWHWGLGADGKGQRHLPGNFPTFLSCGGNGNLLPHLISIPPWWGSSLRGTPRWAWASAGGCGAGQAADSSPLRSAWGRPGPSHAPPGMQGSWELSKSVTFPLESEVSQPPRPGPAFLMGIQHKQGARGRGELSGPSAPPSDSPQLSLLAGRRCLMPEIPHWGRGCKY